MPAIPWLPLFLVFLTCMEVFERYLSYRQWRRNCSPEIPPEVKELVKEDTFKKSQAYNRDKRLFSMVESVVQFARMFLMLYLFAYPQIWRWAGIVGGENEYVQSLTFLSMTMTIDYVSSIFFEIYGIFVIEEKHGFNKMTPMLFVSDQIKTTALTLVIGFPVVCGVIWLIKWGGKQFYVWLWGATMVFTIAMSMLYPNLIAPLFNKFEPLNNEELRKKIEDLAASLKFPLKKLFQMDGSKRSAHSNAYFYGFWWAKRIVIFDTLLKLQDNEILAVLAHELGHWYHGHTTQMMVLGSVQIFFVFWVFGFALYTPSMFESFGFGDTRAVIVGLFLFSCIYSPVNHAVDLMLTLLVRKNEFQADRFAVAMGKADDLWAALKQVHADNLGDCNPDPLYSWYHHSHPPLVQRLQAIEAAKDDEATKGLLKGINGKSSKDD